MAFHRDCRHVLPYLGLLAWIVCVAAEETVPLVDEKPRISSLHIRSDIQYRFATTVVTSRVANPSIWATEAVFDVILPNEAFISNFTLEIDGVIYPGNVKEKIKAEKEYKAAKRRGQSAGHVSQKPRETNKFKIEVAVAAQGKVTFRLTYQELLQRRRGVYQYKTYINPRQVVDDIQIDVAIQESRKITTLHVLPIRNDIITNNYLLEENKIAVVSRPTPKSALVSYVPTTNDTYKFAENLASQFIVEYDVERSLDAGDLLIVNGYFVHFFAPAVDRSIPKDVLFVIDTSGSMSSGKLEQVKEAMHIILSDLDEGDRFNILKFSSSSHLYKTKMITVSTKRIAKAKQYIQKLYASGGTQINDALLGGLDLLKESSIAGERSPVIVFLTDGEASMNTPTILTNVKRKNEGGIPIFSLAFGAGADWNLLQKVAVQNNGIAKKIYPDSDAALQISGFYDELAVTLLKNVTVKYLKETVNEDSLTQSNFINYFKGSEMVVAGQLEDISANTVSLEVISNTVDGQLSLTLDSDTNAIDFSDVIGPEQMSEFQKITERTWAYLTIKQLLRQASATSNGTEIADLKEKAKNLALKYGFVTPLTSMVVTQPDIDLNDEKWQRKPTTTAPTTTTIRRLSVMHMSRGYSGGGGGDPHYLIRIHGIEHPICFDVKSKGGQIQNLLTDPSNDVTMNALIIDAKKLDKFGQPKTFIGQVSVQTTHHTIVVTPEAIFYDTKVLLWDDNRMRQFGMNEFTIMDDNRTLSIRFKSGAEILILRHVRHDRKSADVDYLNVYINNEDGFSKHSTGLIGQFTNTHKHITLKKQWINKGGKSMAKFQVKQWPSLKFVPEEDSNHTKPNVSRHGIHANLVQRSEIIFKGTEPCWMVHSKFGNVLFGTNESFLVDNLIRV